MPGAVNNLAENGTPEEANLSNQSESFENNHTPSRVSNNVAQPQVRETTQTDHINKRLLASFLEHINNSNAQGTQDNISCNADFE